MESGCRANSAENNPKEVTENIPGQATINLTRQGKVNYHGPPSFCSVGMLTDSRDLNEELRNKDETISRLLSDMQLYMGKIKGYQTLGQLYQESKQECARYKQQNEELANKLDVVMKRLLPDKYATPAMAITAGKSYDAATSMTFSTADTQYSTPLERFEIMNDKTGVETRKEELQVSSEKMEKPTVLNKGLEGVGESGLKRKTITVESITAREDDVQLVNAEQNRNNKSPGGSSMSSPSFVCIGGSGLSSMDQTFQLGSLHAEETTTSVGNRPTVVDENTTEPRSLNDLLNDPNSSTELRAMAVDLQRIASRATKIEKQARTQQVLLNELQSDRASLVQELVAKQQELENFQEKYLLVTKKLQQMELEKDPAAMHSTLSMGSFSSAEWVEVEKSESNPVQAETMSSITPVEAQLRSQIQKLHTRVSDLAIMNQNLSEGCEHSERVKQNLLLELQNHHQQLLDLKRNDLKRQQEFDEMLLASKKHQEELETEKEEALYLQMAERRLRLKAEEQCLTLEDTIAQLKNKLRQLERQPSLTLAEALRSSPFNSSVKRTEPSSVTPASPENQSLLTDLAILQQQVTIYKEDFDHERTDRELAQSHIEALKLQLNEMKADIDHAQQQTKSVTAELASARSENSHLKKKFSQALDELKVLKGQIKPVSQATYPGYHPNLYEGMWFCKTCTFENPGIRQSCEMCGAAASRVGRLHNPSSAESGRDYTVRGTFVTNPEMADCIPLDVEKSPKLPHSPKRWAPKL